MARNAASLERYWLNTVDTLPSWGNAPERVLSARIEAFPEGHILADSRKRPWAYDEGFLDRLQDARETWLQATHQTEWDCSDCGTWHVTPDAEFTEDTPCPRTPGHGPVRPDPEPTQAPRTTREVKVDTGPRLTSASLPDLPDDATPDQIAEWKAAFRALRAAR